MPGIFISYRREDSAPYAGRIHDRLSARFGADRVFMDVDDIPPGADFAAQIGAKVNSSDAMVVVLGKDWLTARNEQGRLRLSDPNDYVGLEVVAGLQSGMLVIPVLVGGAQMPKAEELRRDLRDLARRNAVTISDHNFRSDSQSLVDALEKVSVLRDRRSERDNWKAELRRKLLKRLVWKLPLIALLVGFAIWWQWRQGAAPSLVAEDAKANRSVAARLTGRWHGEITYPWGAKYQEEFFFQPEGNMLFGTATFIGIKRGIEDGRIIGDTITFKLKFEETTGSGTRVGAARYEGRIDGEHVLMRFFDEAGSPPAEFVVMKEPAEVSPGTIR